MSNNENKGTGRPVAKSPSDTLSTDALLNSFNKLNLDHKVGVGGGDDDEANPFLDTTTSYIDANLDNLREFRRDLKNIATSTHNNISESTMEIINNNPITPLKRSVSGSSLLESHSPEFIPSAGAAESHKRSNSVPYEEPVLDLELLFALLNQLPDIERYNNFKGILEYYLQILDEHEMKFGNDRFIITIYNQLQKLGHRSKLEKVIDIFLNEPSNFAMKLSNHLYFKDLAIRRKFLRIWLIKRRINHELNQSWKIWMLYLKKKHFSQWTYKHKVITEDLESNALIFNNVKQMMKVWDVWTANFQEQQAFARVADLQQESKFFSDWKERIEIDNDNADSFYQDNLFQRNFKIWKLSTIASKSNDVAGLKSFYQKWKSKQDRVVELQENGAQLEQIFHAGFFLSKWKARSQKTLSKTRQLEEIFNHSVMSKYLNKWSEAMYFKSIENQVLDKRNSILLDFTLNQWHQRSKHKEMLDSFNHHQGKVHLSKFLSRWKNQLVLKRKSSEVGNHTVLKTYFNIWKLSTNLKIVEGTKNYNSVEKLFNEWQRRTQLQKLSNDYNQSILSKFWDKLVLQKIKLDNSLEAGDEAYESYSKVIYFNHWKGHLDQVHENEVKSDNVVLKKVFQIIVKRKSEVSTLEQKAIEFHSNKVSKTLMSQTFKKWSDKYEDSLESKLEIKLSEYNANIEKLKLSSIFKTWKDQYESYLSQEELFKEEFLSGLYLKPTLDKWINKFNSIREIEDKADDVNNVNLLSTGFTKFQLAFLKIEELENKLIEFEDDANVKLILKFVNAWSLKLLKVRRDNENISSFQRRWNRAHCRAILLLWKGKVLDRQISKFKDVDEVDEEDEDDSPTKFKSTFNSVLPQETPRKSIIHANYSFNSDLGDKSPLAFGTNKKSTTSIPGSERIKRKRIEALKSHYSQIKYAIPSPLKSERKIINNSSQSSKRLDFTQDTPRNQFFQTQFNQRNPNNFQYGVELDDSFSTEINEDQISSPVISHQKINQQFFNRYVSKNRSDSDGGFKGV